MSSVCGVFGTDEKCWEVFETESLAKESLKMTYSGLGKLDFRTPGNTWIDVFLNDQLVAAVRRITPMNVVVHL